MLVPLRHNPFQCVQFLEGGEHQFVQLGAFRKLNLMQVVHNSMMSGESKVADAQYAETRTLETLEASKIQFQRGHCCETAVR